MFERFFKYPVELFQEGKMILPGPYAVEFRVLGIIVLAAIVYALYRRIPARLSRKRRATLFILRTMVMALLLLIILPPLLSTRDKTVLDRFVVFLVDDSRSMSIKDTGGGRSRVATGKRLVSGDEDGKALADAAGLLGAAAELGGVRVFRFSEAVNRVATMAEWKGEGTATDIQEAIKTVDERLRGIPVAAMVLVSDGAHTTATDPVNAAQLMAAKGVPIYALGLGNADPPPDREVVAVGAPGTVRRPANLHVMVTVASHGYDTPYQVRLRQDDVTLGEVTVTPKSDSEIRQVNIPLFVDQEGVFTYTVDIPAEKNEKAVENNAREFRMEVQERRLPVLYVEGSPRTEYRFVRGALFRDRDIRIVTVLRTGKDLQGEDRYLVQGLDETMPEYDELLQGFPTNKNVLATFEAVILGDVEADLLSREQQTMIEEFVAKHGRGLLMLGGVNSFNAGGYKGTPVGNMLPLELAAGRTPYDPREFRVRVAEKGIGHPIMHQVDDPIANANIWNAVSPLVGHNPVTRLKPGAIALMEATESGEPILAVQNYGAGRTAAFTTGGSWYWRMNRDIEDKLHERFWRQMIRWLSVGAQPQISVQTDKDLYLPKEPVTLQVTVFSKELAPVNDATVTATVETPFGVSEDVKLEWILSQDGVYHGRYIPHDEGEYKVSYLVKYPDDEAVIENHSRFGVQEAYTELTRAWQNQVLLKALAELTGGAYYDEDDADKLIPDMKKHLVDAAEGQGQMKSHSLWDMPILLLLLVALLLTEWLLRRRSGLP